VLFQGWSVVDIQELAIKIAAEKVAKKIPLPGAGLVTEALLRELLDVQDQQMALLSKIEGDVQRLVDGPWNTGRRYIRQASLPHRSPEQVSQALRQAADCFIHAVDLQPARSFKRAAVCLDVALLSKVIGDTATAEMYATEADSEAAGALVATASAYWYKRYNSLGAEMRAVLTPPVPFIIFAMARKGPPQQITSAIEQYKSVRAAALTLGGQVRDELPDVQPDSTQSWSHRKQREAWQWITAQAKAILPPPALPENKRGQGSSGK
jgi:hypothetical protein